MTWHAPPEMIERYADGTLGDVGASSLEAHVLTCEQCRQLVGTSVPSAALDRIWNATAERIDAPRRGLLERFLTTIGVPSHVARILAVTRTLQLVWLATLLLVSVLAVGIAQDSPGPIPFLVLAPLVPMAAVAVAFSSVTEPGEEIATATPTGGFRLLLYRSIALTATSFLTLAVASLFLPSARGAALWVLPALALTSGTLAAGTRFDPARSAVAIGLGWFAVLYLVFVVPGARAGIARDPGMLLSPALQVGALAVFIGCTVMFFHRRNYIELRAR